jgi:hypothetical protein
VPGPGESDLAARLSAVCAEFDAEKQQILAEYEARLQDAAAVERYWDAASQPGAGWFWAYQQGVPTEEQLRERRDERLDQAKDRLERDLEHASPVSLQALPASHSAPPPLPNVKQINSFAHATLEKAVKAFEDDKTRGDVGRDAKLPPTDVRRVRLMRYQLGLLHLNSTGKLVVDDRVARKGSTYVLRYLDESGTRWLDPIAELRGR